jgi:DNA-binding protein YbaB
VGVINLKLKGLYFPETKGLDVEVNTKDSQKLTTLVSVSYHGVTESLQISFCSAEMSDKDIETTDNLLMKNIEEAVSRIVNANEG